MAIHPMVWSVKLYLKITGSYDRVLNSKNRNTVKLCLGISEDCDHPSCSGKFCAVKLCLGTVVNYDCMCYMMLLND